MAASTRKVNRADCNSCSVVWNYFVFDESKDRVSCRESKQQLCYNRNTSAMREHLRRKHVHIDMTKKERNGWVAQQYNSKNAKWIIINFALR